MAPRKSKQSEGKHIRITLIRSTIESQLNHKECVRGLGLRRLHHTVMVKDTPCIRGMINRVRHLLAVEEAST